MQLDNYNKSNANGGPKTWPVDWRVPKKGEPGFSAKR
jgi:hypothetical protein